MKRAEVRVGFVGDFFPPVLLVDAALGVGSSESDTGCGGGRGVGGAGEGTGAQEGAVRSGGAAGED